MTYNKSLLIRILFAANAIAVSPTTFACSSCGCTLSSDWDSQGYTTRPGWHMDLRYDYLNQSQLRNGAHVVDRNSLTLPNDREIENETKNQYSTLGLDYSSQTDWGINIQVPYINRTHSTIAGGDTDLSYSKTNAIGDVRVLARYQGFSSEKNMGIQFGLKLSTGSFHDLFNNGPQAGSALDRGLQAGTGTTDVLLGLYHFGTLNKNWDYFTQGLIQHTLAEREGYQLGTSLNINTGVRYMANEQIVPQIQINGKTARQDKGINADTDNSGGTLFYLSPGITVNVSKDLNIFGFIQAPIYQNVRGYQLTPHYTASIGVRYAM